MEAGITTLIMQSTQAYKYHKTCTGTRTRSGIGQPKPKNILMEYVSLKDSSTLSKKKQKKHMKEKREKEFGLLREQCSTSSMNSTQRSQPYKLFAGAMLGRYSNKRRAASINESSNKINIGIGIDVTGVSREHIKIISFHSCSITIGVNHKAKNPIRIHRSNPESSFLVQVGQQQQILLGDIIEFDPYEDVPLYRYKLVEYGNEIKNKSNASNNLSEIIASSKFDASAKKPRKLVRVTGRMKSSVQPKQGYEEEEKKIEEKVDCLRSINSLKSDKPNQEIRNHKPCSLYKCMTSKPQNSQSSSIEIKNQKCSSFEVCTVNKIHDINKSTELVSSSNKEASVMKEEVADTSQKRNSLFKKSNKAASKQETQITESPIVTDGVAGAYVVILPKKQTLDSYLEKAPLIIEDCEVKTQSKGHKKLEESTLAFCNYELDHSQKEAIICHFFARMVGLTDEEMWLLWQSRIGDSRKALNELLSEIKTNLERISISQRGFLKHQGTDLIYQMNDKVIARSMKRIQNIALETRIKSGTRFRVGYEHPDLCGKRKQWLFGSAMEVRRWRNNDVTDTMLEYKYKIKMKFEEVATCEVIYPSKGVEIMLPVSKEDTIALALKGNGQLAIGYDTDPRNIGLGDLVECRANLRQTFSRGRVAELKGDYCCVVFPEIENDRSYNDSIPLKKDFIYCVEKGCRELGWLIDAPYTEDEYTGRIIAPHNIQKGIASTVKVRLRRKRCLIRTYNEAVFNVFHYILHDLGYLLKMSDTPHNLTHEVQTFSKRPTTHLPCPTPSESESSKSSQSQSSSQYSAKLEPIIVKNLTDESNQIIQSEASPLSQMQISLIELSSKVSPIHPSQSNMLVRAFSADDMNGYHMLSHLINVAHVTPNGMLIDEMQTMLLNKGESGKNWSTFSKWAELLIRCTEKNPNLIDFISWKEFDLILTKIFESDELNIFDPTIIETLTIALKLLKILLCLRTKIQNFCYRLFGSMSVRQVFKSCCHHFASLLIKYASLLFVLRSTNSSKGKEVLSLAEGFGAFCNELAMVYNEKEEMIERKEGCFFIIRDSLLKQLNCDSKEKNDLKIFYTYSFERAAGNSFSEFKSVLGLKDDLCINI